MNITDIFPSLRVYMNRLAPPRTRWHHEPKNLSHTKAGPGRQHKQGKVKPPHVNPFSELAGLTGA
jgi:hypothetical protein